MRILPPLGLLGIALSACSPSQADERTIDVVAVDYAFEAPDTVEPGPAVLRLTNKGAVAHEVIVMKLRPGVSAVQLLAAQRRDESFRPSLEGGVAVLFANPGTTGDGRLVVDFEAGRDYALWCNFQDGEGAPLHSAMGMFKQIHVGGAGARLATRPARHVVVDARDYVFRVADTLPAGETEFVLTNSGAHRHEASFGRLASGVAATALPDAYMKGDAVDALLDDDGAVLTAYGGEGNTFAVRINLLSGRTYVLFCELADAPDAPPHAQMGMFKTIQVR
jgi:hypothetical protein